MTPFARLPTELQLHVFSYLTPRELGLVAARVCVDWWRLTRDGSLRTALTICGEATWSNRRDDAAAEAAARRAHAASQRRALEDRAPSLTTLRLTWTWTDIPPILSPAILLPRLVRLTLSVRRVNPAHLFDLLVANAPRLEELTLTLGCRTDVATFAALLRLPRLRALTFYYTAEVTDDWLLAVATGCRDLARFDVVSADAHRVTDLGLLALCGAFCPTLTRLRLDAVRLTHDGIAAIAACDRLTHLTLDGYQSRGVTRLDALGRLSRLVVLRLTAFRAVSQASVEFLATRFTRLTKVVWTPFPVSAAALSRLCHGNPHLRHLSVQDRVGLSDADWVAALSPCRRLRKLYVDHPFAIQLQLQNVDDVICALGFHPAVSPAPFRPLLAGVSAVATCMVVCWGSYWLNDFVIGDDGVRFPRLKKLTMYGHSGFGTRVFRDIAAGCPALEHLDVSAHLFLSVASMIPVLKLPGLVTLSLHGTPPLTDADLATVGRWCGRLRRLSVSTAYSEITDDGIATFCRLRRDTLTEMTLRGSQFTNRSLLAVSKCRRLEELTLHDCGSVTRVGALRRLASSLKKIDLEYLTRIPSTELTSLFGRLTCLESVRLCRVKATNRLLLNLAKTSPRLTTLVLSSCAASMTTGLIRVCARCPSLREVTLFSVPGITAREVSRWQAAYPDLSIRLRPGSVGRCGGS